MKQYMVIEDNGGGLTLLVMEEEKVAYVHSGYEHTPGELTRDIEDIRGGADPARDWDGNELHHVSENPEELESWFPHTQEGAGWNVIADNGGTYPDKMGTAGKIEFGIPRS